MPIVAANSAVNAPTEATIAAVGDIIATWVEDGYCQPADILILHSRTGLAESALGPCEAIAGCPLVEYGQDPPEGKQAIRHLSVNRAKGLDSLAVIVVGLPPFAKLTTPDYEHTYFMGASRAKQLLAVVHG